VTSHVATTLARLRVCKAAGVAISPELRDEVIVCLERVADASLARRRRDELIRRAALMIPGDSPYFRASRLAEEAKVMARTWHILQGRQASEQLHTPRDCLHAAALLCKLPKSARQFYRVLQAAATDISASGCVSGNGINLAA
jgi:hypothetical protein